MKLTINKMHFQNFKGLEDYEIHFRDSYNTVLGKNGAGKTSIADGFMWVFFDTFYDSTSNPYIRPQGTENREDIIPCVTIEMSVDGKPIRVSKSQKSKFKANENGKLTATINNIYSINDIDKKKNEFIEYFNDLGVNFEHFPMLSNIDLFLKDYRDKAVRSVLRSYLFSMVPEITDKEIADKHTELAYISKMLETYTTEQIGILQEQTLKKIKTEYGKNGEILNAKIQALENAKVNVNVEELQKIKADYEKQLSQLENITKTDRKNEIKDEINARQKERETLIYNANKSRLEELQKLKGDLELVKIDFEHTSRLSETAQKTIENNNVLLERYTTQKEEFATQYKLELAKEFNDDMLCPVCGQKMPDEMIAQAKEKFEQNKKNVVNNIVYQGKDLGHKIKQLTSENEMTIKVENERKEKLKEKQDRIEELQRKIYEVESTNCEVDLKEIDEKIKALQYELSCYADNKESATTVTMRDEIKRSISEIDMRLGSVANNDNIQKQIDDLKDMQKKYEKSIAGCEKVKYQLAKLIEEKTYTLNEQINEKFNKVEWVLQKMLKNGAIEECCIPFSRQGHKEYSVQTNNALEIEMKLDIMETLQNHFNEHYPIFIDNFESVDLINRRNIITPIDTQTIAFCVDDTELKVKEIEVE